MMDNISRNFTLHYPISTIKEPLLYGLIMDFGLVPNVHRARVSAQDGGEIDVELSGAPESVERGIRWLQDQGLTVESLSDA